MKQIRHYRESSLLKLFNMAVEYGLVVAAYYISGVIRASLPARIATPFSLGDMSRFALAAPLAAAIAVVTYFLLGDYSTIHFRSAKREMTRVFMVQMVSSFGMCVLLFWVKGQQFSRTWMGLFLLTSFVIIFIKRLLLHYLTDKFLSGKMEPDKLIVIGGNEMTGRFIRGIQNSKDCRFEYSGYFAEKEMDNVPGYLGTPEEVKDYIHNNTIKMLVLADTLIARDDFGKFISSCAMYGINAYAIASFNDYILGYSSDVFREDVSGIYLFPLNVMNTDDILGVRIAVTNMEKTIGDIIERLEEWRGEYICVANVHTTVMAHDDPDYRQIQNNAVLSLPDGGPLSLHSRNEGNVTAARVTGPDLMKELLKRSKDHGWKHFFYGATQKTLDTLREKIEESYPGAEIAGMISPPYRTLTPEEDEEYVRQINESGADFLWVGLGAPKQEIWMAAHKGQINALMIGVGAAFDYESGNIKRAPMWMQKANLEWFYRLIQDPKRLFKRYFVTNFKYMWLTRR